MSKPIAVFDIDGTIFRSSLLIEITQALITAGHFKPDISAKYEKSYQSWLDRDGSYVDYINDVVTAYKVHVKGMEASHIEQIAGEVIASLSRRTYRFTRDMINNLKPTHFLIAISTSPTELVSRFAEAYQFDAYDATVYEIAGGRYTGRDSLDPPAKLAKDEVLKTLLRKHNLNLNGSIGVGDSEGDTSFLAMMERPIAFNPDSTLFKEATAHGWQVVVERKDVIYYYNQQP